jgi:hypothetical protein
VFSTIMYVSCRRLIAVVFPYIKFLNILLKYLNVKMVVDIIHIIKLLKFIAEDGFTNKP